MGGMFFFIPDVSIWLESMLATYVPGVLGKVSMLFFTFLCHVSGCYVCVLCAYSAYRGHKKVPDPLEQAVVSHHVGLGN